MKVWLQHLTTALGAWGPLGIFLIFLLDSVGLPIPAAIDLLLVGLAASSVHEPRTAYWAAFLAVMGSVAGNVLLFVATQRGAKWFKRAEPAPGKSRKFRAWFERYGLLAVFVPAVTPIVPFPLKVFVVTAAALGTPFTRFLLVILVARTIRFFGEVYLGLLLGQDAKSFLLHHGWGVALAAFGAVIAAILCLQWKAGRAPSSESTDTVWKS